MFKKGKKRNQQSTTTFDIANPEQLRACRDKLGAIACGEVEHRKHAKVVGQISSIRFVPRGNSQWLEVVIKDNSGIIAGWFFGKKSIPGMIPGANVLFEGLVQLDEGEMTIANPYYEFI